MVRTRTIIVAPIAALLSFVAGVGPGELLILRAT
jgi:hypothetical protein